jgi:hypothetical protein
MHTGNRTRERRVTPEKSVSIRRNRSSMPSRTELLKCNRQLQDHVAALVEDNRQLRAALRIFSEVARREPPVLPLGRARVA